MPIGHEIVVIAPQRQHRHPDPPEPRRGDLAAERSIHLHRLSACDLQSLFQYYVGNVGGVLHEEVEQIAHRGNAEVSLHGNA